MRDNAAVAGRAIGLLAVTAASFLAGSVVGGGIGTWLVAWLHVSGETAQTLLVACFVYGVTLLLLMPVAFYAAKATPRSLGWRRPNSWRRLWWLPIAFVVYFGATVLLSFLLTVAVPSLAQSPRQDIGFSPKQLSDLVMGGLLLLAVAPIAEELMFRGFLFTLLRRRSGFWLSTLLTSALFGLAHLYNNHQFLWLLAADTFCLSVVLCWLREKTGSIWFGVLLHAMKNSLAFIFLFIWRPML